VSASASTPGLSGERRAAILVLLLGEPVAAELLRHLSPHDAARIAREIAATGPIEADLAQEVLQQFYVEALRPPQERGGTDVARRILSQAQVADEIVDQVLGGEPEPVTALGPLLDAPLDALTRSLEEEHPQTAALVLLHLPPRRAAQALRALPQALQAETVLRMTTLREVRREVVGLVATTLQLRMSEHRVQPASGVGGLERTATILAGLARADVKRLLDELAPEHPEEAERLRGRLFTFESLVAADDRGLQEVLRNVDTSKLGLALVGAEPELAARFFKNLSERAVAVLKEEMEFLRTPDPVEQAAARKAILDWALKLEADGKLTFATAAEGGR
jgi:flagellar motor switch protein FliG